MSDIFDINGKVAIITGGSGVLGGSIAKYLAERGVKVVIIGRTLNKVRAKQKEITKLGGKAIGLTVDVLDINQLKEARECVLKKTGRIDFLVNAAGGNIPGATLEIGQTIFDMDIRDYNKVADLNLNGTVYPCLIFGEAMANNKYGSIINISSMATYASITRVPGYTVAKAGVEAFTKWMAMEVAMKFSKSIRVNAIAPGFFITTQNKNVLINPDGSYTERSEKVIGKTPMKRFGNIDELNGMVHFLCSKAASFITGIIIPVDGGFSSFSGI